MKKIFNSFFENKFILLVLSGLFPPLFFLSHNWFGHARIEIFGLLFFTILLTLIGYLIIFLFFKGLKKYLFQGFQFSPAMVNALSAGYSCFVIFFLMFANLVQLIGSKIVTSGIFVVLILIVIPGAYRWGVKYVNLFIAAMVVIACFQWGNLFIKALDIMKDDWFIKNKAHNEKILFKEKPNIYLFVFESYHNNKALKTIFNYDNKAMVNRLERRGFTVRNDVFSNYWDTLSSIASIFAMQHHYYIAATGKNDAIGLRDIIGNSIYNSVAGIFKNNGYKIQYVCQSNYLFRSSEEIDYVYPANIRDVSEILKVYQNPIIDDILYRLRKDKYHKNKNRKKKYKGSYRYHINIHRKILKRLSIAFEKKPYFTFIKTKEPMCFTKEWDAITDKQVSTYVKNIKTTNDSIVTYVSTIIKKDPDGIIILIGDHGAWRYRGANEEISTSTYAQDRFGTFFAIRSQKLPFKANVLSHVNLFRYIFSSLSENEYPLQKKEADESYMPHNSKNKVGVVVRDGKSLPAIMEKTTK